ncbi:hypothetical protein BDY21DRAFT_360921 [Lineolata rhizophorae]|uniref:Uncharacterized protein n=1 Tax=Lineolata rhizophorae TaxID=578093 RepID=A0A6A6PAW8_9PEZI|nr:hypothetical protein BDY21DRAFT_360921 [Lineolata rhizophorae]
MGASWVMGFSFPACLPACLPACCYCCYCFCRSYALAFTRARWGEPTPQVRLIQSSTQSTQSLGQRTYVPTCATSPCTRPNRARRTGVCQGGRATAGRQQGVHRSTRLFAPWNPTAGTQSSRGDCPVGTARRPPALHICIPATGRLRCLRLRLCCSLSAVARPANQRAGSLCDQQPQAMRGVLSQLLSRTYNQVYLRGGEIAGLHIAGLAPTVDEKALSKKPIKPIIARAANPAVNTRKTFGDTMTKIPLFAYLQTSPKARSQLAP